ncbi:MAG: right-handed parallel beta-helix repeat-containing protein [Lysobacterales bacterium]
MRRRFWPACAVLLAFVVLAGVGASKADAATYVVNTFDVDLPDANTGLANCDANAGVLGDQCTLRAAIMQANAAPGQDTIVLPLDVTITLTLGGVGGAENGDLDITAPVIITGISLGAPADASRLPVIEAPANDRIFDITQGVAVELRGLQLRNGQPTGVAGTNGGALRVLSATAQVQVDRVRFSDNDAGNGAAVSNAGTLEILLSDFVRNRTSANGAAIFTASSGSTILRQSSIRSIRDDSAVAEAIYAAQGSTLLVENSLIDGSPPFVGATATGGINADRPASLTVRNSTLSDFTTTAFNAVADGSSAIRIYNSILANSDDTDCRIGVIAGPPPLVMIETNLIENLVECTPLAGAGNISTRDPLLEPLANQTASLVWYRQPVFGSPAVDGGISPNQSGGDPARLCTSFDQFGAPRPQDGDANGLPQCDAGAIERSTLTSSIYTVNQFLIDAVDANPGDDHCDIDVITAGDQCTLRAAVMEANAKPGPDVVAFIDNGVANTVVLDIDGVGGAGVGDLNVTEQLAFDGQIRDGRPLTTISTTVAQRLFNVDVPLGQLVRFNRLRLTNGATGGLGGAIAATGAGTVNIFECEFFGNHAAQGGGAVAAIGASLQLHDADFHDNSADDKGGALYATGSVDLHDSSFWNNSNNAASHREAIRLEDGVEGRVENLTLSNNSGGIRLVNFAAVIVRELTIVDNTSTGLRAEQAQPFGQLQLHANILSGNGLDCSATAANYGGSYNLINSGSCPVSNGDISGNPGLAPALTRRDGKISRVRVPLAGSPVLDAVPNGTVACAGSDQYGNNRPTDTDANSVAACEIGALELFPAENAPQVFTVNVFDQDRDDVNPGDTLCDTSSDVGPQCTLRAAIMEANALPGANTVQIVTPAASLTLTQPNAGGAASAAHGDLDITDALSIIGVSGSPNVRPMIQSSSGDRIFNINAPGDNVLIRGLRLSGGTTPGTGGAIRVINAADVQIDRVEMYANSADQGGGAVSVVGGVVTLDRVDLHDNGTAGEGAAVRNASDLTIHASSIRDNLDLQPAGQREAVAGVGGGITRILNSTLSGNNGHGVDVDDGTLQIENSSLIANDRRGIEFQSLTGRTLFLRNTVISGNADGACIAPGLGAPTISTDGYNLAQDNGCQIHLGGSNFINADAGIGALVVDPARFSAYYLPQPGSPLIDAGHPLVGGLGCIETDQIGSARPIDGDGNGQARCDIGAIEAPFVALPDLMFSDGFED